MIGLIGDADLDLLILPLIVTTLALGQTLETCINWLRRNGRLRSSRVATVQRA